jgi:uncharacterized protein (DUF2062 family)
VIARLRHLVGAFLHLDDTPPRIAAAFGVGVYIAFHPLFGLHTLMALGIAFAFRLSRAAVLVGIYVNNPWTIAPMYLAGTTLGCLILGVPLDGLEGIHWDLGSEAFYRTLMVSLRPYLWPYVIGNTILGIVCGLAAFAGMRWFLERRARRTALRAAASSGGGP